jgi:hypothetical protein
VQRFLRPDVVVEVDCVLTRSAIEDDTDTAFDRRERDEFSGLRGQIVDLRPGRLE